MMFAFLGISICSASSTALTEAMAWTRVQTPQIRSAIAQASRGSRPFKIISRPRNKADVHVASSTTLPPPSLVCTRRCPSIRVIGSTTIRVVDMEQPSLLARVFVDRLGWETGFHAGFGLLHSRFLNSFLDERSSGMNRCRGCRADGYHFSQRVGADAAGQRHPRYMRIKGSVVPIVRLRATQTGVPGLDGKTRAVIPSHDTARVVSHGSA